MTVIDVATEAVLLPSVIQGRRLREVWFTPDAGVLVANAGDVLITIRLDGREPLATAPSGEPGDEPGAVASDGAMAWAIQPPDARRNQYRSVAYHPDDGRSILTVPGLALGYGPGDDWMYTWQNDRSDAVIDARSGAALFTDDLRLGDRIAASDPRATVIVRATTDGSYLDVRRLPDLSPIETPVARLQGSLQGLVVSGDARRIAVATAEPRGTMIHVLDIATGDEAIEPIPWPNETATPRVVNFTVGDRALLVGDEDGVITEINLATGTASSRFDAMPGPVSGVGQLDENYLLATADDGTTSIYDVASGRTVGPPIVSAQRFDPGLYVAPTADLAGHHLLTPDPQGLRLWNIDLSTWPSVACRRAGRNLTPDEWTRYMPAGEPYRSTCPTFPAG